MIPRPLRCQSRVYPRAHGETESRWALSTVSSGLSPCARGNHLPILRSAIEEGSIPVRTGKPQRSPCCSPCPRVYPRAHGETDRARPPVLLHQGLSPCARGNLQRQLLQRVLGSIPVRTGKPPPRSGYGVSRVYPRAHGETASLGRTCCGELLGSIPVRTGKPPSSGGRPDHPGSIPVRTGKPCPCRFRGRAPLGSIPVRTGKPSMSTRCCLPSRVYPRAHGET